VTGDASRHLSVIAVLGPPCAGKTTQTLALSRRLEIPAIHSGDIVRAALTTPASPYQRCADGYLPPPEIIAAAIGRELWNLGLPRQVIIDGFPRSAAQVAAFVRAVHPGAVRFSGIYLRVPDAILLRRSRTRSRADDLPDLLERRLQVERRHIGALKHALTRVGTFTDVDSTRSPDLLTDLLYDRVRNETRVLR
jgi:adenylate kinase